MDTFFTKKQQERLQHLMKRFHAAKATGKDLSQEEQKELENLVENEWRGTIDRADEILQETKRPEQKAIRSDS